MTKFSKLQTILQANCIYTMYAIYGFHTTMTVGNADSLHRVEVTVFWDDENHLRFIREKSHGFLRDGDAYREANHNDPKLSGGWCDFILYFE